MKTLAGISIVFCFACTFINKAAPLPSPTSKYSLGQCGIGLDVIHELTDQWGINFVPSEELVRISPLHDLEVIEAAVCRVEVLTRVPSFEVLLLHNTGNTWSPLMVDKELVAGWEELITSMLVETCIDTSGEMTCRDASSLAFDLVRLLVDPIGDYGSLLESKSSIPTNFQFSDIYRDLRRRGSTEDEIRAALQAKAPPNIAEPQINNQAGYTVLTFFSWNYFGGDIQEWSVRLSHHPKISRNLIAVRVGSYGYYH